MNADVNLPHWEGWHLIGQYDSDVGSWLLHNDGEALLLEVPEGLTVKDVKAAVKRLNVKLRYVTASHDHLDHIDQDVWRDLAAKLPKRTTKMLHPAEVQGDQMLSIGGEPLWLIKAPKHSWTDVVTVFRGVAMTGDIELGMLESVSHEVFCKTKMESMERLRTFQDRAGYHVHTIVSAHLDDVRVEVNWPDLFEYSYSGYYSPDSASPLYGKRWQCRRYGCWGKLVPMERDSIGRDVICDDCGCPDWSDPRRK